MSFDEIKPLVLQTVTDPARAARAVLSYGVPMQVIWLGLALIGVLNGLYYALLLPQMAGSGLAMPSVVASPFLLTLVILVIFALMVLLMSVSGRFLGGVGDIQRVGAITVWLQGLRFLAQVAVSVLSLVSPLLGWLAATALAIWGIWILLNFVAEAHGFSIPKAIATLAIMFVGMILVMSILSAAFGLAPPVPNGDF